MKTLKSKDLHESAAIQAFTGFAPIELQTENGVIWFVFEDQDELDSISKLYWNGQLSVSARAMSEALHSLKRRLFQQKQKDEIN
jgi:hypothetical protein